MTKPTAADEICNMLAIGKMHLFSAKLISDFDGPEVDGQFMLVPSVFLLCGFSMELFLKSFLIKNGWREADFLRKKVGHDLAHLYVQCQQLGFNPKDVPEISDLIEWNHNHHKTAAFRYMRDNQSFLLPCRTSEIHKMISKIDDVRSYVEEYTEFHLLYKKKLLMRNRQET